MGRNEVVITKADLSLLLSSLRCENVHHPKNDRHGATEGCPVVQRIMEKYIGKV